MMENKFKLERYEWAFIILGLLTIIAYIVFASGIVLKEMQNPLSNGLFAFLNMLATFFIAYRISYFSHRNHQKTLAKASIRHIRNHLSNLGNLKKIIDLKKKNCEDELVDQYLDEFKNHVINIMDGIRASEYDFNDIVGNEFKQESLLADQIIAYVTELKQQNRHLEELRKSDESKREEFEKKLESIQQIKKDIDDKVSKLPFGRSLTSIPMSASSLATISGETPISSYETLGSRYSDLWKWQPKNDPSWQPKFDPPLG